MGAADRSVLVRAPGKINVFMRVGAPMPDGYHDVATAYQAVGLFEELRAEPATELSLDFSGPILTGSLPVDRTNLVLRAAHLLQARSGYRGGARIHVVKRVPIAGGMGGGSADAAAALVALDALWGLGLGREELLELGAELGADVPFALTGGTAIGTGRGDRLSPALAKGPFHWVIALSEPGLSTPAVYTALDEHRASHAADLPPASAPQVGPEVLQALRSGDPKALAEALHNDLQVAALQLRPELADLLELGEGNGALAGIVSGSGPTIAFLAADLDSALSLQIALSAARHTVLRATGPVHGARIVG
jgi:4-diphosphocytidyl-2-C-methyl-D-erythritol kinase